MKYSNLITSRAAVISRLSDKLIKRKVTVNQYGNRSIDSVIFPPKPQTLAVSSFLTVKTGCLLLSFMMVNEESLGFGLLLEQKKQDEAVTLKM